MDNVSSILAFSAGLLSFLSPCVLPIIPGYVSFITGSTISELNSSKAKLSLLYKSFGFVLGFSIIFIIMGLSISSIGILFQENQNLFRQVGGSIVILLGLHTAGILKILPLYREKRLLSLHTPKKSFSSIFIGMAFATGWTPCVGPILSSILVYAGSMGTIEKGVLLLIFYSLGLAIPFILTAMLISNFSDYFKKISRYLPIISTISGLLIIIMGILIFTNRLALLSQYFNFINFY